MNLTTLQIEQLPRAIRLTIHRPERRNSMDKVEQDSEIRVVILQGSHVV
jgi:enoyl-CoA hydratase/carnithine racemase